MISRKDRRFFEQAAVVATTGQPHVRVGVVLSQGRRPYVWACNLSGPLEGVPYYQGHAEIRALKSVRPKSTLYVARIDRAGTIMPSHPCHSCFDAIVLDGNIRKVVYYDGTQIKEVKV